MIDVLVGPSTDAARDIMLGFLFALFVAFVLGLVLSSVTRLGFLIAAGLAGAAGLAALIAYTVGHERRARAAGRQILAADPSRPVPLDALQTMTQSVRREPRLGPLARWLARRGFRGIAIRFRHRLTPPPPIEPIVVAFEPCPLNEVAASFRGVAIETAELRESEERSESLRRFRRAWRMGRVSVIVLFVFQVVINGFRAWAQGTLLTELLLWIGMLGLAAALMFIPISPPATVWLVPGGVLHRRPRWLSSRASTHLFPAAESVLLVYPMHGHKWIWAVGNGKRSLTGVGTELEIRTLLRAWLSPLPPPSEEMVRELRGE